MLNTLAIPQKLTQIRVFTGKRPHRQVESIDDVPGAINSRFEIRAFESPDLMWWPVLRPCVTRPRRLKSSDIHSRLLRERGKNVLRARPVDHQRVRGGIPSSSRPASFQRPRRWSGTFPYLHVPYKSHPSARSALQASPPAGLHTHVLKLV